MGHAFRGRCGREGAIGSASNVASSSIWSTRVRKTLTTCESIGRPGSRSPIARRTSTIRRKKGRRLRIEQRRIASFQSSSKPVVSGGLRRREIFLKHIRVLRCVNIEIPDAYLHRGRCGDRDRRFFLCIRESGYPCRPTRQPVWQPRVGSVPSERRGTEAFGRDSEDCDQSEG